ncbi:14372_t:CDS:2, partial [Acaulospora colombiana]
SDVYARRDSQGTQSALYDIDKSPSSVDRRRREASEYSMFAIVGTSLRSLVQSASEYSLLRAAVGAQKLAVFEWIDSPPSAPIKLAEIQNINSQTTASNTQMPVFLPITAMKFVEFALGLTMSSLLWTAREGALVRAAVTPTTTNMQDVNDISYVPELAWITRSSQQDSASCLAGTKSSSTPGSYLEYKFTGSGIQLYTAASATAGSFA